MPVSRRISRRSSERQTLAAPALSETAAAEAAAPAAEHGGVDVEDRKAAGQEPGTVGETLDDLEAFAQAMAGLRAQGFGLLALRREAFGIVGDLDHRVELGCHEGEPAIGLAAIGAGLRRQEARVGEVIGDGEQDAGGFGDDLAFGQTQRGHLAGGIDGEEFGFALLVLLERDQVERVRRAGFRQHGFRRERARTLVAEDRVAHPGRHRRSAPKYK